MENLEYERAISSGEIKHKMPEWMISAREEVIKAAGIVGEKVQELANKAKRVVPKLMLAGTVALTNMFGVAGCINSPATATVPGQTNEQSGNTGSSGSEKAPEGLPTGQQNPNNGPGGAEVQNSLEVRRQAWIDEQIAYKEGLGFTVVDWWVDQTGPNINVLFMKLKDQNGAEGSVRSPFPDNLCY